MIVPMTLIGTAVTQPQMTRTGRGVPVAKFRMSTSAKVLDGGQPLDMDVTTWPVTCFDKLALYAANLVDVGQHVIVYGQASESRWERNGQERREFEVRADAIAPNSSTAVEPARLTLVGTIQGKPALEYDEGAPFVDLTVRTARWRALEKGAPRVPMNVTDWPVVATGATALTIADQFGDGDDVIVYGEARGVARERADGTGEYQDIEVWADAIGPDLKRAEGRPA